MQFRSLSIVFREKKYYDILKRKTLKIYILKNIENKEMVHFVSKGFMRYLQLMSLILLWRKGVEMLFCSDNI